MILVQLWEISQKIMEALSMSAQWWLKPETNPWLKGNLVCINSGEEFIGTMRGWPSWGGPGVWVPADTIKYRSSVSPSILGELHPKVHPVSPSMGVPGGNTPRPCCAAPYASTYHRSSQYSWTCHCTPRPTPVHCWIPPTTVMPSCTVLRPTCVTAPVTPYMYSLRCEALPLRNAVQHTTSHHHASPCPPVDHCSTLDAPSHPWIWWPRAMSLRVRPHPISIITSIITSLSWIFPPNPPWGVREVTLPLCQ